MCLIKNFNPLIKKNEPDYLFYFNASFEDTCFDEFKMNYSNMLNLSSVLLPIATYSKIVLESDLDYEFIIKNKILIELIKWIRISNNNSNNLLEQNYRLLIYFSTDSRN